MYKPTTQWCLEHRNDRRNNMKTRQKACRVYYPQSYSTTSHSYNKLQRLLSKGWKVVMVTVNENYFADYILEKEVE